MPPRLLTLGLLAALAGAAPSPTRAECEPGREVLVSGLGTDGDLLRLAGLAGAAPTGSEFLRREGTQPLRLCAGGEGFAWVDRLPDAPAARGWAVLPVRLDEVWAPYPVAENDGLLWQGRGFGTRLSAGAFARVGPLTAAVAPEIAWQQNAWFATVPSPVPGTPFANPLYGAAYGVPQRFGAGPFWSASPGQSYLRVDAFGVGVGVSTENLWLGPGARTAILVTDAGPGFPHAFLGTSRPVDFGIGGVEVLAAWGRLDRSVYAGERNHPWFSALALGWEPRWVPGLHLGAARTIVETAASLRSHAFLSILETSWNSGDPNTPQDNHMAALWFRWVLPKSALELYGEWGKDDIPASFGALLRETEKTQAWLLGMQKVGRAWGRRVRVQLELASFAGSGVPFYTHTGGIDYTNGGQPLGSYAGPGGLLAFLGVDLLGPRGRFGLFAERLERNSTVFDMTLANVPGRDTDRDTEVTLGLRGVALAGPLELTWEAGGGYHWNRDFGRNEPSALLALSVAAPAARASSAYR